MLNGEYNQELVDFIIDACEFPKEMKAHLFATMPESDSRNWAFLNLCMQKYVIGNGLATPETCADFVKSATKDGVAFANAFLAYVLLRKFGMPSGANYTLPTGESNEAH